MKLTAVLFALPISFFLFSCAATTPKHGPVKTEERTLGVFNSIHASDAFEIDFSASSTSSATVEAPDDVMGKVITKVNNGTLEISIDGEIRDMNQPIYVHLKGTSLEAATLTGACSLNLLSPQNGTTFRLDMSGASSFRGTLYMKELNVNLSGASFAKIEGMTNSFRSETSGASTLDAKKMSAVKATVKSDGASNITLRADSIIDAQASGASSISYTGDPVILDKEVHGASSIGKD